MLQSYTFTAFFSLQAQKTVHISISISHKSPLQQQGGGLSWMAIEIKLSNAPTVSKDLDIACDHLKIE